MKPADPLGPILNAAAGLLYPSESDAPLTPVRWGTDVDAAVKRAAAGRPVETQLPDAFFAELERSDDDGPRWKSLHDLLTRTLKNLRVYRIGERRVDVFLVGQTPAGEWAGLRTVSVET